jgi:hypothetical protein
LTLVLDSAGDRRLSLSEAEDEPEDEEEESSVLGLVSIVLAASAVAEWDVVLIFLF